MKNYTQEEIKKIAREFLGAVKSKTGWRTTGVMYSDYGAKPILTVNVPGWSNKTELDDYAKTINPEAQKKLEEYWKIEETFKRKYKDMGFSLSGGGSGEKVANKDDNMNIGKEIVRVAKSIISKGTTDAYNQELKVLDTAISFFRKELANHRRKQKSDPDNILYVSDIKECANRISFLEHILKIRS